MWSGAFREYGWEESDLTRAIAEHLTNPVMQKIAMEVLSDEQKEEEQEEMPLYEDNPLDLPALDDELTVLAMQPDIKLDESRTLPGVKLLKNEELERWYVINRAGIEGERESLKSAPWSLIRMCSVLFTTSRKRKRISTKR